MLLITSLKEHDISYGGFESMHVTNEIQNLLLLFKMSMNSQIPTNRYIFFYHGQLEKKIDWK
jgi:hypothetical protein